MWSYLYSTTSATIIDVKVEYKKRSRIYFKPITKTNSTLIQVPVQKSRLVTSTIGYGRYSSTITRTEYYTSYESQSKETSSSDSIIQFQPDRYIHITILTSDGSFNIDIEPFAAIEKIELATKRHFPIGKNIVIYKWLFLAKQIDTSAFMSTINENKSKTESPDVIDKIGSLIGAAALCSLVSVIGYSLYQECSRHNRRLF